MTAESFPLRVMDREVLRYLGFPRGATASTIDGQAAALLSKAKAWSTLHVHPEASHVTYDVTVAGETIDVGNGVLRLRSASLARMMARSRRATLLAVTAGDALDGETARLSAAGRMAEAAVLDALGSDAVEEAADDLCAKLAAQAAQCGFRLTPRFSPGYGDLSLAYQPALVEASGAKDIGMAVGQSMMLSPMKSITAVVGWEPGPPKPRAVPAPCDSCELTSCRLRRPGLKGW